MNMRMCMDIAVDIYMNTVMDKDADMDMDIDSDMDTGHVYSNSLNPIVLNQIHIFFIFGCQISKTNLIQYPQ
jgi:hypothetical protein